MEIEEIKSVISQFTWYHAIQFAENIVTPGRFSETIPPNYTLFPVFYFLENMNLDGMSCIDIGTVDGIVSFIAKQEGASQVVATDRGNRDQFRLARKILNLDIDYLPSATLDGGALKKKLAASNLPEKYDLVVLSGVIYHSYDPLLVMMHARSLLKPNGLFIVESAITPGDEKALFLNWEIDQPVREANTYFVPTLNALEGLMRFCSCSSVSIIHNGNRGAVLGRACPPSKIEQSTDMLKLTIDKGACYGPINYKDIEHSTSDASSIRYSGMEGPLSINSQMFSTRFQLQPPLNYSGKGPLVSQPTMMSS